MRLFEPKFLKVGLVALVAATAIPGHLMAAACNAFINGNTESQDEYILGEPIGIILQIGAGLVEDDFQNPGYLDISQFEYQLDCEAGDTFPDCTPAGNTVVFDEASVQTTCVDENAQPITFNTSEVDGTVTGVHVLEHRETPGLGDRVESGKSDWVQQFDGRSLTDPAPAGWAIRRDGGQFDQLTGASVTPRAIVKAIRQTLLYFDAHRDEVFAMVDNSQEESEQ